MLEKASITKGGKTKRQTYIDKAKEVLTGVGASEIITYAFFGKSSVDKLLVPQDSELYNLIRITNPLGEEVSCMRTTLVPGMLNILSLN
ncbi:MAG: phenylalanine--tRNA ligase subunit beta, partial [Clostridia bacterium]|nr:phenylalanine--tRNA ligase subunit beta [Clostridia bacterium]